MAFFNIGFGNLVNSERVVAIVAPESAPVKRIVQGINREDRYET